MTLRQEDQLSLSTLVTNGRFSKWVIVKILPFPEVPGTTKRHMYFSRTSNIR